MGRGAVYINLLMRVSNLSATVVPPPTESIYCTALLKPEPDTCLKSPHLTSSPLSPLHRFLAALVHRSYWIAVQKAR